MTGISQSDQKKQLDTLFKDLKTIGSRAAAMEIEQKIWDIWVTHPSDRKLTEMLSKGSGYMSQNRLGDAYIVFTEVIALDDKWAEAWNKRATVLYLMGEYEKSQKDIDKVLSYETDDVILDLPDGTVVEGKDAHRQGLENYFSMDPKLNLFWAMPYVGVINGEAWIIAGSVENLTTEEGQQSLDQSYQGNSFLWRHLPESSCLLLPSHQ